MNRILFFIVFIVFVCGSVFVSCRKAPKPVTKEELRKEIDSATNVRIKELYNQAQIDLERRMTIEVKAKTDSIVNARMMLHAKDTMRRKNTTPKLSK